MKDDNNPPPLTVSTAKALQQYEVLKAAALARIGMRTTPIPVTVGTFEVRQKHEGLSDDS